MERVSGWYKRKVQWFLILIAVVLTLLLNVDSFAIGTELATNATLRTAVVAAAEQGRLLQAEEEDQGQQEEIDPSQVLQRRIEALRNLQDLGLPIGWGRENLVMKENAWNEWLAFWPLKLLGLLVTAVAVSFGAPFWFDLLNKLINVRMSGKNPQESTS